MMLIQKFDEVVVKIMKTAV